MIEATLEGTEPHPASKHAYRWLKGFMVQYPEQWLRIRMAIEEAAFTGNRQAEVCLSTIERLKRSEGVSDRYMLGLAWTVLSVWKADDLEWAMDFRLDFSNPHTPAELPEGGLKDE